MKFKSLVVVLSLLPFDALVLPHALAQTPSPSPTSSPVALKTGHLLDVRTGKVTYVVREEDALGDAQPQGLAV